MTFSEFDDAINQPGLGDLDEFVGEGVGTEPLEQTYDIEGVDGSGERGAPEIPAERSERRDCDGMRLDDLADIGGVAGDHGDRAFRSQGSNDRAEVRVGNRHLVARPNPGSHVRRRTVEPRIANTQPVHERRSRRGSIPPGLDAYSRRSDQIDGQSLALTLGDHLYVGERPPVMGMANRLQRLHGLVVEDDDPARCHRPADASASAHSRTSSASASGCRSTMASAA